MYLDKMRRWHQGGDHMDAHKFGAFITECRKEKKMTQADLAEKLHVTDKAVSRWERGLGFPDINTLEPLADALDLSILELMKSEKNTQTMMEQDAAEDVLKKTLNVAVTQRREERKKIFHILWIAIAAAVILLAIDWISLSPSQIAYTILGVLIPLLGCFAGCFLLVYSIWRKKHHMQARQTLIAAIICFGIMLLPFLIMFILGASGRFPVPD